MSDNVRSIGDQNHILKALVFFVLFVEHKVAFEQVEAQWVSLGWSASFV